MLKNGKMRKGKNEEKLTYGITEEATILSVL